MLGIVVSAPDDASVRVGEHLRDLADWETEVDDTQPAVDGGGTVYRTDGAVIREFETRHLHLDRPAQAFDDVDLLAFASQHAGETGPLLTAHHTGNFGPADHGGEPNALARACPAAHSRVLAALAEHAPDGYDVGMECTHHGPTDVGAPSMFVEVGSGPEQWADPDAARAVAAAILDLRWVAPDAPTEDGTDGTRRHVVGFGGGHYAPRFERIARDTDWAVGHVAADWGLDALDDPTTSEAREVIDAAFSESRAAHALVVEDRPALRDAVADLGYRVVDETWLRETSGLALELVDRVESALQSAEGRIRFGENPPDATGSPEIHVRTLPGDLLDAARGIDLSATRAAFQATTIGFVADQGGTRPTGAVAIATDADVEALVDRLGAILAERYDAVERVDDELVVRETAFRPEKAASLGVPEGPKFGQLAAGEPVEVDGREIPPEAVTETTERRFQLR